MVSEMLPYDRPDCLDIVGAIKAIGKIRKIIWKLAYKQTSFLFNRLPSTQFSGYRLQTRSQALTSSLLLGRLCGDEMKDPKNEVGSPKHKLRPLSKGFFNGIL